MSEVAYPACISELYQSEVLGEQLFLALVAVARNEREKYHFGTFLQLESETKVRLRPFLGKYGLEFVESADSRDQIAAFIPVYEDNNWHEFLAQLQPTVEFFVTRFQQIAKAGPAEDRDILESMVRHEESFLHWIEKETAGEEGSLDLAISQLQYPLAPL